MAGYGGDLLTVSLRSQTSTVKGDQAGVGYSTTFFLLSNITNIFLFFEALGFPAAGLCVEKEGIGRPSLMLRRVLELR